MATNYEFFIKLLEEYQRTQSGGQVNSSSLSFTQRVALLQTPEYAKFIPNSGINNKDKKKMPVATKQQKINVDDEVIFKGNDIYKGAIFNVDRMGSGATAEVILTDFGSSELDDEGYNLGHKFTFYTKDLQLTGTSTPVEFDTVIIADEKRSQILEALEQVSKQDLIFKTWGFGETIEKGKGISMLFYGLPGTGKTLMAQAIANKLGYKLKIISTADVQSSAPGQSERNIRKHFADAKKTITGKKTILLFDECDSLIYSRSNVGAILGAQINELLSQLERFDGITIFTTNRLGMLDEAVDRRLALKLEFEMPTHAERVKIWQRMIPAKAPLHDDVDFDELALTELAGGHIKNAVLRAARMAATQDVPDKDKKIKMEHLSKALKQESQAKQAFQKAKEEFDKTGHNGHGRHQ